MSHDETSTHAGRGNSDRERALVRVSAALATRDPTVIRDALEAARLDAPSLEVEEVLLQSHLFLGFPAAIGGLALWREIAGPREAGDASAGDAAANPARGRELCRRTYGSAYEALRANIAALHPDLDRWMVEDGYGKVLGRPGLDPIDRELAVVGLLAVLGTGSQLHSHLRGALNVGASPEQVERALDAAREYLGAEKSALAADTWNRVRERAGGGTTES